MLQTRDSMGPQHGYAIAARLEPVSSGIMRIEQRRWLKGKWQITESNRPARAPEIQVAVPARTFPQGWGRFLSGIALSGSPGIAPAKNLGRSVGTNGALSLWQEHRWTHPSTVLT